MPKADTKFKLGNKGGPGRPKGKRNQSTDLKRDVLTALEILGKHLQSKEITGRNRDETGVVTVLRTMFEKAMDKDVVGVLKAILGLCPRGIELPGDEPLNIAATVRLMDEATIPPPGEQANEQC